MLKPSSMLIERTRFCYQAWVHKRKTTYCCQFHALICLTSFNYWLYTQMFDPTPRQRRFFVGVVGIVWAKLK
jgi:hypothetical protein